MAEVASMPRYYFSLRSERPFNDVDGLELPDLEAVRKEAVGFARDMMRMELERRDWADWTVCVTDDAHKCVFKLAFVDAN
jgi:uncharacterized protein DUF6894